MNAVGIDVSKGKSTAAILRPLGEVVQTAIDLPHDAVNLKRLAYQIYARYLTGASLGMLRDWLIESNIPNGKGKWTHAAINGILTNEKFCGDVLMQKTYTSDCITHKAVKNNEERPMYLIQNNPPAIVDRKTYNAVQTEVARRKALQSPSKKTPTGQSCYTSKYALSDRVYCMECNTRYKRTTWAKNVKRKVVWCCVSRLDYGKKYRHNSPTIEEEQLKKAILAAINSSMSEKKVLIRQISGAMEIELLPEHGFKISLGEINARLKALEYDFQKMLARAADDRDYEVYTERFKAIAEKIAGLKEKRSVIEAHRAGSETDLRIRQAIDIMENGTSEITQWDESLIRLLVD